MTNERAMKIWGEVLEEVCQCYADDEGNRPCDYGSQCVRCSHEAVDREYKRRLKAEVIAEQGENRERKWTVIVHDIATYYDIKAKSEDEAVEQALEWWDERQPRWHATEEFE